LHISVNHSQSKYSTGYRWGYSGTLRIEPSSLFNVQNDYNRSIVKHVLDDETEQFEDPYYEIWRTKAYYHFTRNLNARIILQYNGMGNRLDIYGLIAYNFRPGDFLYIAYTECFDSDSYTDDGG
jgi:hypothetical protein